MFITKTSTFFFPTTPNKPVKQEDGIIQYTFRFTLLGLLPRLYKLLGFIECVPVGEKIVYLDKQSFAAWREKNKTQQSIQTKSLEKLATTAVETVKTVTSAKKPEETELHATTSLPVQREPSEETLEATLPIPTTNNEQINEQPEQNIAELAQAQQATQSAETSSTDPITPTSPDLATKNEKANEGSQITPEFRALMEYYKAKGLKHLYVSNQNETPQWADEQERCNLLHKATSEKALEIAPKEVHEETREHPIESELAQAPIASTTKTSPPQPVEIYEGELVDGKRSGLGKLTLTNCWTYEGPFSNGLRHGKGKQTWEKSGTTYIGDFLNGQMTGEGRLVYPNGSGYKGTFINGNPTGKGYLLHSNNGF